MTEELDSSVRNVLSAFPRRPLRILRTGEPNQLGWGVLALLMLALVCAAAVWMAPEILRDMESRKDPVPVPQAYVDNGRCSKKLFLVSCGARLAYSVDDKQYATSVSFFFVSGSLADGVVTVVRSASRPDLVTLDIGLERIWNRIGTLVGAVCLFIALGVCLLVMSVRAARFNRIAKTTDDLTPLSITVRKITVDQRGRTIACSYESDSRRRRFSARLDGEEQPFFIGARSVLGVLPANCPAPVMVDEALSRLDLTDKERQVLYAAREVGASASDASPRIVAVY